MSGSSNFPAEPVLCGAGDLADCVHVLESRVAQMGASMTIRRALPTAKRRMVGAWCFLDPFGPATFEQRKDGMTSGRGISHTEESPEAHSGRLMGYSFGSLSQSPPVT